MSYAAVAAHNAPPPSEQPHADPALLNTQPPTDSVGVAEDMKKINIVGPDFKSNPTTTTSQKVPITDMSSDDEVRGPSHRNNKSGKAKAKDQIHKAEEEGAELWELAKARLLQPGVAGGLVGLVNIGLLSWASYALYTEPALRRDTRLLATGAAGALALLGAEGYLAEQYAQTPKGRDQRRRAKEEGDAIYRHTREVVLRPGVMGGLVGLANLGVLGTVGYFAYTNWDSSPRDRRMVAAVSVGLLALWAGEGALAEKYANDNNRKRR